MFTNYHDEPRLEWLCEQVASSPHCYTLLRTLGLPLDTFDGPGDVTAMELFRDAIDKIIYEDQR